MIADRLAEAPSFGTDVVYDLALPPDAILSVLPSLPDNAAVLIQKPMGRNLKMAKEIKDMCKQKNLTAAVNFQLRFSPMMLIAGQLIQQNTIGTL